MSRIVAAALLAIGVLGLVSTATGAQIAGYNKSAGAEGSARQQAWRIVQRSRTDNLSVVDALSDQDVWVAGEHRVKLVNGSINFFPLLEHWDGARWRRLSPPIGLKQQAFLWDVAAVSTDDVWVVGATESKSDEHFADTSLLAHWDGAAWKTFPKPAPPAAYSRLTTITAIAADDVWAIGTMAAQPFEYVSPQRLYAEHWDGTRWSLRLLPIRSASIQAEDGFAAVDSDSTGPDDVWIVGTRDTAASENFPYTAHWNGRRWTVVQDASNLRCRPDGFDAVVDIDEQNVWAVAQSWAGKECGLASPPVEHWNGTRWRTGPGIAKPEAGLNDINGSSANDVWAVGYGAGSAALVEHWNGTGWTKVAPPAQPNVLYSVAVPAEGDVWAVGEGGSNNLTDVVAWKSSP